MKLYPLVLVVALGCSSDEAPSFPTFQECFDDQPFVGLPEEKILTCCLDTVIDGERYACGATAPDCINYLTNNLRQTDATTVEVQQACEMYEDMRPLPAEG